jgi:hypothetical protein
MESTEAIEALVLQLTARKPMDGCAAMRQLLPVCKTSSIVYPYMAHFIDLLNSGNSYVRTRALTLIIANARWDTDLLIDENIDRILDHVIDPSPITARQFIQRLSALAFEKPLLQKVILNALASADPQCYQSSMRPLVEKDLRKAMLEIKGE